MQLQTWRMEGLGAVSSELEMEKKKRFTIWVDCATAMNFLGPNYL